MRYARAMRGLLGSALWLGLGAAIVDAADAVPPEAGSVRERSAAEGPVTPEQLAFFESKIRPVLVSCYKCHAASSDKIKGELLLDTREGIRKGGDPGAAVVPGNLEESLLIQAIRYKDDDLKMPPKTKLPDEVIADLERWVAMGAPDPRDGKAPVAAKGIDIEEGRQFWAFQPPRKSTPPEVKDEAWPRSDIDRFLLERLEAKGLKPVGDADSYTLLRRVYFDLIGLPPTPEEWNRSSRTSRPRLSRGSSTGSWPCRSSASAGAGTGSTWRGTPSRAASRSTTITRTPGATATMSSTPSTTTSPSTGSSRSRSPATCCRRPTCAARRADGRDGFPGHRSQATRRANPFAVPDRPGGRADRRDRAGLPRTDRGLRRCHDHKFDPIPTRDYYAMAGIFNSTQTCYGTTPDRPEPEPARRDPAAADSVSPRPRAADRPAARTVAGPGR